MLCLGLFWGTLAGQTPRPDSVSIRNLEKRIRELESKWHTKQQEDELKNLLEEANRLSAKEKAEKADISKKFHSGLRRQQGLNPNISVSGDFFGGISSSNHELITEPGDFSYGNNGAYLRGVDLSFISPLDPYSRGKVFLCATPGGLDVEEAYMDILNLPFRSGIKVGIFRPEFGLLNRYHEHALPQFDRPLVLRNYFGLDGLAGTGLATNTLLPRLLFADASSMDLSLVSGGNDFSFTGEKTFNPLLVIHLKNYYDLSESSYFEYTLSGATGRNDPAARNNTRTGSVGIHYKWMPPERSKYRTFNWKTEFFLCSYETAGESVHSRGFYSSVENKLNARLWLSGRIGYSEYPFDNTLSGWSYTVCMDYWQSEWVFFRIQYQYNDRSITGYPGTTGRLPDDHSLILQINWAMGPHKHEAY